MPLFSATAPNHADHGICFGCGSRTSQAPVVVVSGAGVTLAGVEAPVEAEVPEDDERYAKAVRVARNAAASTGMSYNEETLRDVGRRGR